MCRTVGILSTSSPDTEGNIRFSDLHLELGDT